MSELKQETITCPHCLTDVKKGANVCVGCHAEIKYGLSAGLFFGYYILLVIALLLIAVVFRAVTDIALPNLIFENFITFLILAGIAYIVLLVVYIVPKYENHVSFTREKKH